MNRIKQLRKFFNYTQDRLAKLLGVSRSTVAMWETTSQEPDYLTLSRLSQIFNISPDFVMGTGIFSKWDLIIKYYDSVSWELIRLIPRSLELPSFCEDHTLVAWLDTRLYSEPDEMQLARWFAFAVKDIKIVPTENTQNGELNADVEVHFTSEFEAMIRVEAQAAHGRNRYPAKAIPVLGEVAAGIPIEAVQDIVDYEEIDQALATTGEFFGLRIKGSSMEPRMREGDVVIVRKQEDVDTGDTAVVLVNGNEATVKKIKKGEQGITLLPTNPAYDPMFFTSAEIESLPVVILGKVVELRAKF